MCALLAVVATPTLAHSTSRCCSAPQLLCDHSVASLALPPGFTRVDGKLHYGATPRWIRILTAVVGLLCTAMAYLFAEKLMSEETDFPNDLFGMDRYYPNSWCHWIRRSDDQCTGARPNYSTRGGA